MEEKHGEKKDQVESSERRKQERRGGNDERRTREQVMKEGQETTESINAGVSC